MLTRRQLLTRGTTMLLLVPIINACSSNNSSTTADAASGSGACAGIDSTSTVNDDHSHAVCVPTTDLTSPPTAGVTYTSTNVGNHTHTIMLTQAQLQMIESGSSVGPITSSSSDGHTHDWTITKM
jgi:hypothetical protein